ncbi:MAG TPA: RNA polymerase sigma factor [Polyangiaceae bacterium]|jgi:RNA polymerase sigma-70 factor (ECF subfamily)
MSPRRALRPAGGVGETAPTPDPELLRQLALGEIGALGGLYDRHHEVVRRFLTRATGHAEDVDDLVHATFLGAAQSAGRYDGRPSCRPWLVGIAAQLLRRRRQTFGRFMAVIASLRNVRATTVDPRFTMEARTDLDRALAGLSEAKRVAILMAEVEGLSCPEIAAALEIPVGTVWTRLHAARRELRRALDEGGES